MITLSALCSTVRAAAVGAGRYLVRQVRSGWFWTRLFLAAGALGDVRHLLARLMRPLAPLGIAVGAAALFDDVAGVVMWLAFDRFGAQTGWLGMHLGAQVVGVGICVLIVVALASLASLGWAATRRR